MHRYLAVIFFLGGGGLLGSASFPKEDQIADSYWEAATPSSLVIGPLFDWGKATAKEKEIVVLIPSYVAQFSSAEVSEELLSPGRKTILRESLEEIQQTRAFTPDHFYLGRIEHHQYLVVVLIRLDGTKGERRFARLYVEKVGGEWKLFDIETDLSRGEPPLERREPFQPGERRPNDFFF